mgnify:CR=1 FL=1|jgi:hypothetical protein
MVGMKGKGNWIQFTHIVWIFMREYFFFLVHYCQSLSIPRMVVRVTFSSEGGRGMDEPSRPKESNRPKADERA